MMSRINSLDVSITGSCRSTKCRWSLEQYWKALSTPTHACDHAMSRCEPLSLISGGTQIVEAPLLLHYLCLASIGWYRRILSSTVTPGKRMYTRRSAFTLDNDLSCMKKMNAKIINWLVIDLSMKVLLNYFIRI